MVLYIYFIDNYIDLVLRSIDILSGNNIIEGYWDWGI